MLLRVAAEVVWWVNWWNWLNWAAVLLRWWRLGVAELVRLGGAVGVCLESISSSGLRSDGLQRPGGPGNTDYKDQGDSGTRTAETEEIRTNETRETHDRRRPETRDSRDQRRPETRETRIRDFTLLPSRK